MRLKREQAIRILSEAPALYGREVGFSKLGLLHNEWIKDMVFGTEDATLQAHRGSYKTTCLSIAFAIIAILHPDQRVLFMRKTDKDVKEIVRQTQGILEHGVTQELCKAIWGVPLSFTQRSLTEFTTNLCTDIRGTSQLTGIGTGGSITGKHFDRVFTDDIVNAKDRVSRAERERIKLVYQELKNIVNRGGRRYNTGTPWHKDDAFSIMPNPARYDCYTTGLLSQQEIQALRHEMSDSLFAANYELKHIADTEAMFKEPKYTADRTRLYDGVAHIDAAYGGGDYTAYTACKQEEGGFTMFGRIWHGHVDDCIDEIVALQQKYRLGTIFCETNADKGYLAKELKTHGLLVKKYNEKMNKHLKISTYLRAAWDKVEWLDDTDPEYILQVLDYTENAEHDDAPDSAASVLRELTSKTRTRLNTGLKGGAYGI